MTNGQSTTNALSKILLSQIYYIWELQVAPRIDEEEIKREMSAEGSVKIHGAGEEADEQLDKKDLKNASALAALEKMNEQPAVVLFHDIPNFEAAGWPALRIAGINVIKQYDPNMEGAYVGKGKVKDVGGAKSPPFLYSAARNILDEIIQKTATAIKMDSAESNKSDAKLPNNRIIQYAYDRALGKIDFLRVWEIRMEITSDLETLSADGIYIPEKLASINHLKQLKDALGTYGVNIRPWVQPAKEDLQKYAKGYGEAAIQTIDHALDKSEVPAIPSNSQEAYLQKFAETRAVQYLFDADSPYLPNPKLLEAIIAKISTQIPLSDISNDLTDYKDQFNALLHAAMNQMSKNEVIDPLEELNDRERTKVIASEMSAREAVKEAYAASTASETLKILKQKINFETPKKMSSGLFFAINGFIAEDSGVRIGNNCIPLSHSMGEHLPEYNFVRARLDAYLKANGDENEKNQAADDLNRIKQVLIEFSGKGLDRDKREALVQEFTGGGYGEVTTSFIARSLKEFPNRDIVPVIDGDSAEMIGLKRQLNDEIKKVWAPKIKSKKISQAANNEQEEFVEPPEKELDELDPSEGDLRSTTRSPRASPSKAANVPRNVISPSSPNIREKGNGWARTISSDPNTKQ